MEIFNNKYSDRLTIPVLDLKTKLWNLKFKENHKWIKLSFVKYKDAIEFYTAAVYYFYFLEIKNNYGLNESLNEKKK